jgi:hypothetical protein
LHLFTKYTGVRELYWERSADGRNWSPDRKLAGIRQSGHNRGGHYQTSASLGSRVGTFFNRHPNGNVDQRTDVYYVETHDFGDTWQSVDGLSLTPPLTKVDGPAQVVDYASQGLNVYLKDMGFDHQGFPVLLYVTSRGHEPGPPNDPRHFRITRWDGQGWQTSTVCTTDHNYDMGSLYLGKDGWSVRVPSLPGPQPHQGGGELMTLESHDRGQTWTTTKQITRDSTRNHNYARRPIGAKDPFYVFWADGDPTQLGPSFLYFADSAGERVWRLPQQMDSEWAAPELLTTVNQETH